MSKLARTAEPRSCALALVFTALLASCETAPITGRQQFIVISPEAEIELGVEAYRQALDGATLSGDAAIQGRVRRVGMRIVEASRRTDLDWEFKVVEDDSVVNAWALPGGKVAVYTGLLKIAGDDDALLATVLGHEIAHVTARHGAERITQQLGINIVAAGLERALYRREPETVELVMIGFGIGSKVAVELPFGRNQESEADHAGLIYMARAGYDPRKAIEFWQRMSEQSGSSAFEFLSTHPSYDTRLQNLHEWQAEALAEYRPIE